MQTQIKWRDADSWAQRLQSCYHLQAKQLVDIYSFPLEEVLYQLLLQAKLEEPTDSLEYLQKSWDQYHKDNPSFITTVDELISEGWLDEFCGRWSLVGRARREWVDVYDEPLNGILKFLLWLAERIDIDRSAVYLDNWEEQLKTLREVYPELPEIEWFIEQHILYKDKYHFYNISFGRNHGYYLRALARLWYKMVTPEDRGQWLEMSFQLGATADIVEYLPQRERSEILFLLTERMLNGRIPNADEESKRINRNHMFQTGKFDLSVSYRNLLSSEDSAQNLTKARREHWEEGLHFWHRNKIRYFEIAAMIEHCSLIPREQRKDVLERLKNLHSLGVLNIMQPFDAESTLQLLEYPITSFMALHTLTLMHQEQCYKGNTAAGDCILSWILYVMQSENWGAGEPINELLAYLSEYAYRGAEYNQIEKDLLNAILRQLSRYYFSRMKFLEALSAGLVQRIERAQGLTWCRYFQLMAEWTQQLSLAIPKEQHQFSDALQLLFDNLRKNLFNLLDTPYNPNASYISPAIFELPIWTDVYLSSDSQSQARMCRPVLTWYLKGIPSNQEKFHARYQFRIGISLLTTLAKELENNIAVMKAYGFFLHYILDSTNQILSIENLWSIGDYPELIRAIQQLKFKQLGISTLLSKFQALRSAELIVLIQYVEDSELRGKLLEYLENRSQEAQDLELVGWDKLVGYILDQKIESLYDLCEKRLQEHLAWGKEIGRKHHAFERSRQMLSWLWLLRGDFERLFKEGDSYIQAAAYTEEGEWQNLDLAIECWKSLAKNDETPEAYINWLLAYLKKLEGVPENGITVRRELYQSIEQLRVKVETELLERWGDREQLSYAEKIVFYFTLSGQAKDEAVHNVAVLLKLSEEKLTQKVQQWNEDVEATCILETLEVGTTFSFRQIVQALQQFRLMPLRKKAECFFANEECLNVKRFDVALVLLELFRALYHLGNYGDKLVYNERLYEDHCTQLLRELLNLNGAEWWKLAANDQQQMGSTGTLNRVGIPESAENDLMIKCDGYQQMMLEAMVLDHVEKGNIKKHIGKLIGDNITNIPMAFVVYGNSRNHTKMWDELSKYLYEFHEEAKQFGVNMDPFSEFKSSGYYLENQYDQLDELAKHSLITHVSHKGTEGIPLFIICADISKRSHTRISKHARGN